VLPSSGIVAREDFTAFSRRESLRSSGLDHHGDCPEMSPRVIKNSTDVAFLVWRARLPVFMRVFMCFFCGYTIDLDAGQKLKRSRSHCCIKTLSWEGM
jgi:hypothetical protein